MVLENSQNVESYDRLSEVKAFDETKAGVKGLVDAGIKQIPRMFVHEPDEFNTKPVSTGANINLPIIDLSGIDNDPTIRAQVIEKLRGACETTGFFYLINHGIPETVMNKAINGIRKFHDQDLEAKKQYFSRDYSKKVLYNTNFDLYQSKAAHWRDGLTLIMAPNPPSPSEIPEACRDEVIEYTKHVMKMGLMVNELLSECLGLDPNHLNNMGCAEGIFVAGHYYAACPEPDLTMGIQPHAGTGFTTLLLQDNVGGLQVLIDDHWVDVNPIPGSIVFNIGDMMKLITNDRFVSSIHRVVSKTIGPRISVASIFRAHLPLENSQRLYGPIKELCSAENPPRYREITVKDILAIKHSKDHGISQLEAFKL